jgi:uncharacterized hydrophobic protein (TIGR00271 family)
MASITDSVPLSQKLGFDPGYLEQFQDKLFIEGVQVRRRLVNFFVLLLLATVIATYGVLSGSTATVIGAMIVAPLMGPIMATTAAVVMGSAERAWRSLVLVIVGVIAVVLFSALLASIIPDVVISFTENAEITSRIQPGLFALFTALGAGAAGAFIISRAEIADSMGGVAIAISLVPPLCVVGIAVSQGEWHAAGGAMLLFLTNFFAILFAGGLVFMMLGLGRVAQEQSQVALRRRSFALIILGTLLVTVPLCLTGYRAVTETIARNNATTVVQEWLQDAPDKIIAVAVDGQLVTVSIEGSEDIRSVDELAAWLEQALGYPVTVTLHIIPTQTEISRSQGVSTP